MGLNKYRILLVLDDSLSFFKILESTYSKKRQVAVLRSMTLLLLNSC